MNYYCTINTEDFLPIFNPIATSKDLATKTKIRLKIENSVRTVTFFQLKPLQWEQKIDSCLNVFAATIIIVYDKRYLRNCIC